MPRTVVRRPWWPLLPLLALGAEDPAPSKLSFFGSSKEAEPAAPSKLSFFGSASAGDARRQEDGQDSKRAAAAAASLADEPPPKKESLEGAAGSASFELPKNESFDGAGSSAPKARRGSSGHHGLLIAVRGMLRASFRGMRPPAGRERLPFMVCCSRRWRETPLLPDRGLRWVSRRCCEAALRLLPRVCASFAVQHQSASGGAACKKQRSGTPIS